LLTGTPGKVEGRAGFDMLESWCEAETAMNQAAIKQAEIIRELALIPASELEGVKACIAAILAKMTGPERHRKSLKGVWQGQGFEKIEDLEGALRESRAELRESILRRDLA
jgi:hypothetical protein